MIVFVLFTAYLLKLNYPNSRKEKQRTNDLGFRTSFYFITIHNKKEHYWCFHSISFNKKETKLNKD